MDEQVFYGQFGQDIYVMGTYFPDKMEGTYVDIGAHDGIYLSNTYLFEKRGWTGYCIEPLTDTFNELKKHRPGSICVHAIISGVTGETDFLSISGYSAMLSGEIKKYSSDHLNRIDNEIAMYGGTKEIIRVKSYSFNDLIQLETIDFLSIDVEGGEMDIIKNIDFNKYYIKVIAVENNHKNPELIRYIESNGFKYITKIGDCIFKNNRFR